jgi:hypothetical protein
MQRCLCVLLGVTYATSHLFHQRFLFRSAAGLVCLFGCTSALAHTITDLQRASMWATRLKTVMVPRQRVMVGSTAAANSAVQHPAIGCRNSVRRSTTDAAAAKKAAAEGTVKVEAAAAAAVEPVAAAAPKKGWWHSAELWGGLGATAGWGMSGSASTYTMNKTGCECSTRARERANKR